MILPSNICGLAVATCKAAGREAEASAGQEEEGLWVLGDVCLGRIQQFVDLYHAFAVLKREAANDTKFTKLCPRGSHLEETLSSRDYLPCH